VNGTRRVESWVKRLWLSTWPLWALLAFASLAAARLLPGGYTRAALAAPILLIVPGSLMLRAIASQRHLPHGLIFVCYAVVLSAVWSAFASLALYVNGWLITAESTYWCLLVVSAVLAIVAQTRLLLGRPGRGRRAARKFEAANPDESYAEANDLEAPVAARGTGYHSIVAVVAGVGLLVGGLYAYDHSSHPAPTGYTWIAWSGPPIEDDIAIGSNGKKLTFQIVHHQSNTTTFKLSAVWLGSSSKSLAKPLTFSIGPNQTFQGALFVPALPNGCTYRIVVTLTDVRQIDPLTRKPQTWAINADVHDPTKSSRTCG
jgi:hypothetical protein